MSSKHLWTTALQHLSEKNLINHNQGQRSRFKKKKTKCRIPSMISICSFLSYSNTSFARTIRESNDNFILLLLLRHMYSKKKTKKISLTLHTASVSLVFKKNSHFIISSISKHLHFTALFSPCSPTALLISLRFFIFIYWLLAFGFWYFYTLHPRTRARIIFIKERQI